MSAQVRGGESAVKESSLKETVAQQFGNAAEAYRTSTVHAAGEDLALLVAAAKLNGKERVLDAGSGAGHTALAVAAQAGEVISVDLAADMLAQGRRLAAERGLGNVEFQQGDVEALPFPNGSFDRIVTRYSAHHWQHPLVALRRFRRLLRPGGLLVIDDIVSYDEVVADTWLQAIELLRDPSHVRDHTPAQWLALCTQAGFYAEVVATWPVRLNFDDWVKRMATPADNVALLRKLFDSAPAEVRAALEIGPDYSFSLRGALIRGA